VGPLVLLALGIGGAWIAHLTALEPLRPWFIAATLLFLGLAFRRLYLQPQVCEPGTACAEPAHFSDRGHPFHADRGHRFTPMADSAQGMRVTGFIVSQVSAMAVKSPVLSTPARSAGVGNSAPKAMLV